MIIQSRNVYYDEMLRPLQIEISGDKITKIMPYGTCKPDRDYGENWIVPGLIDIHNHGYNGSDANHATPEFIREWMKYLPREGVTSTLPTTSSAPRATMLKGMEAIAQVIEEGHEGANILGIHSEGPFISEQFRGAQDPANLVIPTEDEIKTYQKACNGHLILVMLAPEMLKGDMSVVKYCVANGIKVTCGHTGATFEDITMAREAGAVSFTHTYNGMRGLHHREPGVVGAAMYYDDMYAELIGDGVHVSFPSANILAKAKGPHKLISVTDSVYFKGLPVGEYEVEGQKRYVCEDGVGRLANGTICGSANRLNVILGREITKANIPYQTAINSCTCNPANMLGFGNVKGYIRENYDADITVLDSEFNPVQTYVMGGEML